MSGAGEFLVEPGAGEVQLISCVSQTLYLTSQSRKDPFASPLSLFLLLSHFSFSTAKLQATSSLAEVEHSIRSSSSGIMEAVLSKIQKYKMNLRRLTPGGRWSDVVKQALHFIILLCFTEEDISLHLHPPGRKSNIEGAGL